MTTIDDPLRIDPGSAPALDAYSGHAALRAVGDLPSSEGGPDWRGRKACAVMKVVSSIMLAVAVFPGGDGAVEDIDAATRSLLDRATELAEATIPFVGERAGGAQNSVVRNQLRQYAADTICLQWRLAHSTGHRELSVEQITAIYRSVAESSFLSEVDDALTAYPSDAVAAKRMALVAVVAEVHNAVGNFDYFHPDPQVLVDAGVRTVIASADGALDRLLSGTADSGTRSALTQTLYERTGVLYAENYRAIARKEVKRIKELQPDERFRLIHESKLTGLPTTGVDDAFRALVDRMVVLIVEAAPDLGADRIAPAISAGGRPTLGE